MTTLVFVLTVVLLSSTINAEKCQPDVDHTNEQLYWQSCNKPGDQVVVSGVAIINDDGSVNYPVDLTRSIDLVINVTNSGTETYDNLTLAITLARYTSIFGQCSWAVIPTLGLLDHIDACVFHWCPLAPGSATGSIRADTSALEPIIALLNEQEPYKVGISLKTHNGIELGCVNVEIKITKHS